MSRQEPRSTDEREIDGISFEDALAQLERIVRSLEAGQSGLEASLQDYEKGIRLLRHCHATLQNAERRIEILKNVRQDGGFETEIAVENQFLTDAALPGQRRGTEAGPAPAADEKTPVARKKRVRKAVRENDLDESDDIPFDFD